jgi:hypothetical protein
MKEKQLSLFGDFFNIPKNKNNLLLLQNRKNIVPLQNKNETDKMLGKAKIAKVYKELPAPVDFIRFGNEFVDEFLSGKEATKLTINALKIVFNIVSQLRNEQFQEKNQPQQLRLFEEEFASEHNLFAEIKIKNSLITRNTEELKKAYFSLATYKYGYYEFINSDGSEIEALGGLISQVFFNKTKGYTVFLINSYWMKRLLQIDSYNKTLYNLVYNVRSNKHILFYFWLSKIPMEGTIIKVSTLNEYFDINYPSAREICRDFLKSIRENLNKYSHKSFNYNYMGELITIKPYLTQYIDSEATMNEATKKEIKSDYKIRYFKDRHQLTEEEIKQIKYILEKEKNLTTLELFSEAYESFVADCRKKDEKATDYIGRKFLIKYQEYIELSYSKTKEAKYIPRCPFQVY